MAYHTVASYEKAHEIIEKLQTQLGHPITMVVDDRFQEEMAAASDNKRGKIFKRYNKTMTEIDHLSGSIHTLQIELRSMIPNLSFVLKNAHNKASYLALARYFAKFEHFSKKIKREKSSAPHEEVEHFVKSADVLDENFFSAMMDTINQMKTNIEARWSQYPDQYALCDDEAIAIDFDAIKASYKDAIADLKKSG